MLNTIPIRARRHDTLFTAGAVVAVLIACGGVTGEEGDTSVERGDRAAGSPSDGERVASGGRSALALEIGEAAVVSDDGEEVGEVTVQQVEFTTEPDSEFADPPEFDWFLLAEVNARATGDEIFVVNPFDFWVRDPDGRRYGYAEGNSLFAFSGGELDHAELNPGEQVTGALFFDVPDGPLELVYAPELGSRALAYWTVDAG